MKTAISHIMELLGIDVQEVARRTGYPEQVVECYVDEEFIDYETDHDYEIGEGMPQVFARDFALSYGIHRSYLENADWEISDGVRMPVVGNSDPFIDGTFGSFRLSLPGGEELVMNISQTAASDLCMPANGEPVAFLDDRMHAHILRIETLDGFRLEEDSIAFKGTETSPINPEALYGMFDIVMTLGVDAFLDAGTRNAFPGIMSPEYVASIQEYFDGQDIHELVRELNTVKVTMTSGVQRRFTFEKGYSDMMAGFYRSARDKVLPPFFMLSEGMWVEGIPMGNIAMISIPWVIIARYGAHIDLDLEFDSEEDMDEEWDRFEDFAEAAEADDGNLLTLTDDLIPTGRKPN
jgi:hypothetical protein